MQHPHYPRPSDVSPDSDKVLDTPSVLRFDDVNGRKNRVSSNAVSILPNLPCQGSHSPDSVTMFPPLSDNLQFLRRAVRSTLRKSGRWAHTSPLKTLIVNFDIFSIISDTSVGKGKGVASPRKCPSSEYPVLHRGRVVYDTGSCSFARYQENRERI